MITSIEALTKAIIEGRRLTYNEANKLVDSTSTDDLCRMANNLREHFAGKKIDTCSIINARSGRCSEDCKWCSQSKFHKTTVDVYPLVSTEQTLEMAKHNADRGVRRFSLVTSGRAMSDAEIEKVSKTYKAIADEVGIKLCASMGLLTLAQLEKLRASGVERYHCNLETAPSYFPSLCSTHTTEQKIETIKNAQKAGMQICSGGIIGMGETMAQRVELAITLREIGVDSIPVNVLNPIPGTPLEGTELLSHDELLRSFAMFRIVNPDTHIRFAGGRTQIGEVQEKALRGGVSAAIVGDMLTTVGSKIDQDMEMFRQLGYEI